MYAHTRPTTVTSIYRANCCCCCSYSSHVWYSRKRRVLLQQWPNPPPLHKVITKNTLCTPCTTYLSPQDVANPENNHLANLGTQKRLSAPCTRSGNAQGLPNPTRTRAFANINLGKGCPRRQTCKGTGASHLDFRPLYFRGCARRQAPQVGEQLLEPTLYVMVIATGRTSKPTNPQTAVQQCCASVKK